MWSLCSVDCFWFPELNRRMTEVVTQNSHRKLILSLILVDSREVLALVRFALPHPPPVHPHRVMMFTLQRNRKHYFHERGIITLRHQRWAFPVHESGIILFRIKSSPHEQWAKCCLGIPTTWELNYPVSHCVLNPWAISQMLLGHPEYNMRVELSFFHIASSTHEQ